MGEVPLYLCWDVSPTRTVQTVCRPPAVGVETASEKTFQQLEPESQGRNLALTVLCVPYSLDDGAHMCATHFSRRRFSSYTKVYSVIYDPGSVPSKSHLLSS